MNKVNLADSVTRLITDNNFAASDRKMTLQYIAKSIVGRHHGTIDVESKEGIGSTFTLSLPTYSDQLLAKLQPDDSGDHEGNIARRKRGWITKNIAR